jgi:hypothetical protein
MLTNFAASELLSTASLIEALVALIALSSGPSVGCSTVVSRVPYVANFMIRFVVPSGYSSNLMLVGSDIPPLTCWITILLPEEAGVSIVYVSPPIVPDAFSVSSDP